MQSERLLLPPANGHGFVVSITNVNVTYYSFYIIHSTWSSKEDFGILIVTPIIIMEETLFLILVSNFGTMPARS